MSEFVNITTPSGYLFVHYTNIKIMKKDGAIHAYFGDGVVLQMDDQEASELIGKLEKLSTNNSRKENDQKSTD